MIYCHLIGKNGKILYSTLPEIYLENFNCCNATNEVFVCNVEKIKKRHGKSNINGEVVYLLTSDEHIVNRPRYFRELLNVHHKLIPDLFKIRTEISKEVNDNTKRFVHNVTSINAIILQNIYSLIPEETLRKNMGDQISLVKKIISEKPIDVAITLLKILKNNNLMKLQFRVFKKLYEPQPIIQIAKHQINKVIGNVLSVFFHMFKEKHIKVNIQDIDKEVSLDYESFHTALFFVLDNASKYTLNGTEFNISFKDDEDKNLIIVFDMVSCKINDDEVEQIYKEGVSGYYAKKLGKNGDGIGMGATVKALELNKATLNLIRDVDTSKRKTKNDILYVNNIFEIKLTS